MIPTEFKGPIHIYWNVKYGWLQMSTDKWESSENLYLASVDVEVEFDTARAASAAVEAFDAAIQAEKDASLDRIQAIKNRQAEFMAISSEVAA